VDGLYHRRRGRQLLDGVLDPAGWVDAGLWGSRMSRTPVTSGDRLAPMLGHDHRRVAAIVVSDLPAGARADPAAGSLVLHQGRRAARVAARGRGAAPHQPETAAGLGGPGALR